MVRQNVPTELLNWHVAFSSAALFLGAFIGVNLLTPIVIWVSRQKRLVTPVNNRSSHWSDTPPFGGVVFYLIFIVFIPLIELALNDTTGYHIIPAISILFMIGLKDDLVHSTVNVKLLSQLLAGTFSVLSAQFRITGPFMGFQLGTASSALVSLFLLILIINAYNLIDGIDGLAALTGGIICIAYASLFCLYHDILFFLLNIATLGMLTAFLRFNLLNKKWKIFMGDCGSLTIGLVIGLSTLRLLASQTTATLPGNFHQLEYKLLMVFAILFIPFLDTSRIILIRLLSGKSPFKADKNHIHHILINYGLSHIKASILLSMFQILAILAFFIISAFAGYASLILMLASMYLLTAFFVQRVAIKTNKLKIGI